MQRPRVTVAEFMAMSPAARDEWLQFATPGEIAAFNNELIPDSIEDVFALSLALIEADQTNKVVTS